MGKKKNKIKSNTNKISRIKNNTQLKESTSKILFRFEYENWLKAEKMDDFSNYVKDSNYFTKSIIYLFHELIPNIDITNINKNKHIHPISGDNRKKLVKIITKIHGSIEVDDLWQFGIKGGLRLICNKLDNVFIPLLIDYHHCTYQSVKYNQQDISRYSYCPIEDFKNK